MLPQRHRTNDGFPWRRSNDVDIFGSSKEADESTLACGCFFVSVVKCSVSVLCV
jgi:hypothetical protein